MASPKDTDRLDIEAYVARARRMRSEAMGELIFAAARALRGRLTTLVRKLAHSLPAAQH